MPFNALERPKRRPEAVIFDMDGLMLDTESLAARAWSEAAKCLGIPFDAGVTRSMVGRTSADCRRLLIGHHGDDYPVDLLMTAWSTTYDAIIDREGIETKPGLYALLDWLETERIAKGVATSTRHARACSKLERCGLLSRFVVVVGGDQVTHGKPHPEIFLTAAYRLGCAAAQCLVLEDSEPGFRAAVDAGMAAIVVPERDAPPFADPVPVPHSLRSLHEVREFLAGLPAADAVQPMR